jgi:hypothetical protein
LSNFASKQKHKTDFTSTTHKMEKLIKENNELKQQIAHAKTVLRELDADDYVVLGDYIVHKGFCFEDFACRCFIIHKERVLFNCCKVLRSGDECVDFDLDGARGSFDGEEVSLTLDSLEDLEMETVFTENGHTNRPKTVKKKTVLENGCVIDFDLPNLMFSAVNENEGHKITIDKQQNICIEINGHKFIVDDGCLEDE